MTATETQIELGLVAKLVDLKYTYQPGVCDRAALEANFRERFRQFKWVKPTEEEFARLLGEIVASNVFKAAQTLCTRNSFTREDGTPLSYTLVQQLLPVTNEASA